MSVLQEKLASGQFAITAEMAPPKGCDFTEQLEVAELLKCKVDAVNVTDMQSACLKASSLGLCIHLKQAGIEPILQITGLDRNRMAIMGDILAAAGYTMNDVVKTTVLLAEIADFAAVNAVYAEFFTENKPARAAFAVKDLPRGALVEIEAIAAK